MATQKSQVQALQAFATSQRIVGEAPEGEQYGPVLRQVMAYGLVAPDGTLVAKVIERQIDPNADSWAYTINRATCLAAFAALDAVTEANRGTKHMTLSVDFPAVVQQLTTRRTKGSNKLNDTFVTKSRKYAKVTVEHANPQKNAYLAALQSAANDVLNDKMPEGRVDIPIATIEVIDAGLATKAADEILCDW